MKARRLLHLVWLLFLAVGVAVGQTPGTPPAQPFEGTYRELLPQQKRLVDDWAQRFREASKRTIDTEEGYDSLPMSIRTTFNAVTHALMRTPLTTDSGETLRPSALALVSKIDAVHGAVQNGRGDVQFRIYVQLAPDALDFLDKAREFGRAADNTVYHKGYPVCYRGRGGVPSIQVSATRDGRLADIDVDYRSAKFPVFLFNGHLSSSNSDVRVGNNDERHNNRWTGLNNWWRRALGLLSTGGNIPTDSTSAPIAVVPKLPKGSAPELAIHDFLDTWFVDQKPGDVIPYVGDDAIACMQLYSDQPIDLGMVRVRLLTGMRESNAKIGKVASLSEVTEGVDIPGSRRKVRKQPHREFVLYDVRDDAAEQMKCGTRLDPSQIDRAALTSTKYGTYVGAAFRMKRGPRAGTTVATLWKKADGYWRLIAYTDEDELARTMNLPVPAVATPPMAVADADPAVHAAALGFATRWFVDGDVSAAMAYLTPAAFPCVKAYTDDAALPAESAAQQREAVRQAMQQILDRRGKVSSLRQAIAAPEVSHPDIKVVRQRDAASFFLVSIPDSMYASCEADDSVTGSTVKAGVPLTYGTYFVSGFRLEGTVGDPNVLWLLWAKVEGAWKIVAFRILSS